MPHSFGVSSHIINNTHTRMPMRNLMRHNKCNHENKRDN